MTLLVQTESRVQQRKERRREARAKLLDDEVGAALEVAYVEVERMQAPLIHVDIGAPAGNGPTARLPFGVPLGNAGGSLVDEAVPTPTAAGESVLTSTPVISNSSTRGAVEQASRQLHKYYLEEFRNVLNVLARRLQVQMEEKDEEDLVADSVMERLRRLVPSEMFVAWAAWTASVRMVDPDKISDETQWIVWGVYGFGSFVYVLMILLRARCKEESIDVRAPGTKEALRATGATTKLPLPDAARTASLLNPAASLRYMPKTGSMPRTDSQTAGHGAPTHLAAVDETRDDVTLPAVPILPLNDAAWRTGTKLAASSDGVTVPMTSDDGDSMKGKQGGMLLKGSPSTLWLVLQAFASMLVFLLISAVTGEVYMQNKTVMWTLSAAAPLLALFTQFFVPSTE